MDTEDKKNDIIQTIQSTNDEQMIEEVYELLYPNEAIETIEVESLPVELQNKVNRALDDYKNGKYLTHDQLKQKVNQWLTN